MRIDHTVMVIYSPFYANKEILGDGVATGFASIEGRPVFVFAQDVTVFGGSAGREFIRTRFLRPRNKTYI